MANNNKKKKQQQVKQPIYNQIIVRSADNSSKDAGAFNTERTAAQRIHFPSRTGLYNTYDNYLLDGFLYGLIQKRINSVLNKELYYRKEDKEDPMLAKLAGSKVMRDIVTEILLQQAYGLSGFFFENGTDISFKKIPRKHIKPDLGIISYHESGNTGIEYDTPWNLWVIGDRHDYGYLLNCMPYAIWKRGNMADWAQFNELFGMPIRIARYNMHDPQSKIEAKQSLTETGSAVSMLLPEGVDFDIKESKQASSNGDLQNKFRQAMNEEMSVVVLGNTETTTSSQSSGYSQSKVHAQQQLEVTRSDMAFVLDMLNSQQFRNILTAYGYDVQDGEWMYNREYDQNNVRQILSNSLMMQRLGLPIDPDELYEATGFNKPKDYDQRVKQQKVEQEQRKKAAEDDKEVTDKFVVTDGWRKLFNKLDFFR